MPPLTSSSPSHAVYSAIGIKLEKESGAKMKRKSRKFQSVEKGISRKRTTKTEAVRKGARASERARRGS